MEFAGGTLYISIMQPGETSERCKSLLSPLSYLVAGNSENTKGDKHCVRVFHIRQGSKSPWVQLTYCQGKVIHVIQFVSMPSEIPKTDMSNCALQYSFHSLCVPEIVQCFMICVLLQPKSRYIHMRA